MGRITVDNYKYDENNSALDILGEYSSYLNFLSDKDLMSEYEERKKAWMECPIPFNVQRFQKAKQKMMEKGLLAGANSQENSGSERAF